jgi:hypothetical protein
MAIKFSQFTVGSTTSDIDYLVGYKNTDNIQIPVGLVGTNTTYAISTAQAGANETITLTGSDSSTDLITITAGSDISLTDDGAGNGFTIASTVVGDTYTIGTSTNGSSVDVNLDAAAGADSNITLTPATGISIAQAGGVVTITNTAPGDTYSINAGTKVGSSVPINLDAATGSDSVVSLTEGTGITLTQTSATEITIEGSAGTTVVKDQFTGNNSATGFTLSTSVSSADNLNIFISGVYQNSVDSGGTANYSVSGTTLTFVTPPPTTATNGIEVVITQ